MRYWLALVLFVLPASAFAQAAIPADYQAVLTTLGKQGDFKENVLRVNVPRNDLHVVIDGVATPTPFGPFPAWSPSERRRPRRSRPGPIRTTSTFPGRRPTPAGPRPTWS